MSIEATVWALKYAPPMPPKLLGTLFGLADHADKHGRGAYPSVPTLAAYACKTERSVQRDLKELSDLGLIRLGDQNAAAHIPAERRPTVYDLAMENTVPGGRAGDDAVTQASRVTLASSRARGGRKTPAQHNSGVTPTSPVTSTSPPDAHVTPGVTPTSEWGDAHVATGVTPTSPKPPYEPPTNHPLNQRGAEDYPNHPPREAEHKTPSPIDNDGFQLTDSMRAWALRTFGPNLDLDYETAQFLDHFRANGSRRPNWPAEWQKWIRRSAKYASERANRPQQGAFLVPLPGGQQPTTSRRPATGTDARVAEHLDLIARLEAREAQP